MTAETIHTCSYSCERPECIRAQRDELASRLTAPPPAAARGDVRGLVALAERVQYADTHAQVSKDDAGEFVYLPPWLWLEIRDAAVEALAAEGVQAGARVYQCPRCATSMEVDPTAKPEARGVVDDAMVERATMALLGKSHDTAPGVDWRCDRTWTVNKVRKHMRAALTAALAAQPGGSDNDR